MKNTIHFLLLFLSLSCANINVAASWQNCQANDSRTLAIQEELYAIGFSGDNRAFAYIKQGYEEGIGSYYWQFTIQDLATDKTVERIDLITAREKQKKPPPEFIQSIEQLLKAHSIKLFVSPEFAQFPVESNGSLFNAFIINGSQSEDNGIRVKNLDLFLVDKTFNFKRIGRVSEILFFGHQKRFGHKIIGYIEDQKSDKMVVGVAYKNHENEEDDVICTFALFGANSRIKKQELKTKIAFIENIIEGFPEQTDAYLELGDIYWKSGELKKAKIIYQSYIERMKASNSNDKVPSRVYKRVGVR